MIVNNEIARNLTGALLATVTKYIQRVRGKNDGSSNDVTHAYTKEWV
jgi:hypothetical protein